MVKERTEEQSKEWIVWAKRSLYTLYSIFITMRKSLEKTKASLIVIITT